MRHLYIYGVRGHNFLIKTILIAFLKASLKTIFEKAIEDDFLKRAISKRATSRKTLSEAFVKKAFGKRFSLLEAQLIFVWPRGHNFLVKTILMAVLRKAILKKTL